MKSNLLSKLPHFVQVSEEVSDSISSGRGVVALESTVITHGLPFPQNIETMHKLEDVVRKNGAEPATIIVLDGKIHIGLNKESIKRLNQIFDNNEHIQKLAVRDLPMALARKQTGGTTVSATMYCSQLSGISVFATGGIGGVHRDWNINPDVSMDLIALSHYPVIVVSAGCKAILDIPATIELLESLAVPIYGWQTDSFPAFYSSTSNYKIQKIDTVSDIVQSFVFQNELAKISVSSSSGVLVANPIPKEYEIPAEDIEPVVKMGIQAARDSGIYGKDTTPFLLAYLSTHTQGLSVKANLALLENNARLAANIASEYAKTIKNRK